MSTYDAIRNYYWGALDDAAATVLLAENGVGALCAALSTLLHADDEEAVRDACLVIRDGVMMARHPRREEFWVRLTESGIIARLEALLFADSSNMRDTAAYTLGKIGSRASLPALVDALTVYRDTDPLLVPRLISEGIWLGANQWPLLAQALESPVYMTRWGILDILGALYPERKKRDERRRVRYLETLRHDTQSLVRQEATYYVQAAALEPLRDRSAEEQRHGQEELSALEPPFTYMTCSIRFSNYLHQAGRTSYTVRELEDFIDHLVSTG